MVKGRDELSERIALRLSPDELAKLERLAHAAERSMSDMLRLLIRQAPEPKKGGK